MKASRHILIDTDTGVDDALALLYALHSPGACVEAITTVAGNVEVHKCTRNVSVVLGLSNAGYTPVVAQGAAKPLRLPLVTAPEVHGQDGLGDTQKSHRGRLLLGRNKAVECIRSCCDAFQGDLTIVALGPLTNLALAYAKYPKSLRSVRRIVSMGGAFAVPGNTGPVAEFNYFVDPHAASIVLNSGLPVTVVPLDLTEQVILTRQDLERIHRRHPSRLSGFILESSAGYMKYHKMTLGFEGGYLHDPMAVAIALDPSLAAYRWAQVGVHSSAGITRGMTDLVSGKRSGTSYTKVAVSIEKKRFLRSFYRRVLNV